MIEVFPCMDVVFFSLYRKLKTWPAATSLLFGPVTLLCGLKCRWFLFLFVEWRICYDVRWSTITLSHCCRLFHSHRHHLDPPPTPPLHTHTHTHTHTGTWLPPTSSLPLTLWTVCVWKMDIWRGKGEEQINHRSVDHLHQWTHIQHCIQGRSSEVIREATCYWSVGRS